MESPKANAQHCRLLDAACRLGNWVLHRRTRKRTWLAANRGHELWPLMLTIGPPFGVFVSARSRHDAEGSPSSRECQSFGSGTRTTKSTSPNPDANLDVLNRCGGLGRDGVAFVFRVSQASECLQELGAGVDNLDRQSIVPSFLRLSGYVTKSVTRG